MRLISPISFSLSFIFRLFNKSKAKADQYYHKVHPNSGKVNKKACSSIDYLLSIIISSMFSVPFVANQEIALAGFGFSRYSVQDSRIRNLDRITGCT